MEEKEKSYRVNVNEVNMKRITIIKALFSEETETLSDKEAINYIVNKAIENYFKSEEIQNKLKNLQ
ncbi:hypothetical protein [Calditerrivibrio nitroreducens]|uniref:Uncharacterized protein n=1 Tax=Calditerrivibrio nitroreducens (strain DSM 19672 / NBRC 101217 / Yu37-1) TaxID=768670 RepID=E4TKA5_CALNY|nr:hypothetical protein [Calditerrivibrio nitroreducens]ADR19977.1 hypothetical protein Calni_2086 [Calditerrivibrio nitroreducens DSM 19672]